MYDITLQSLIKEHEEHVQALLVRVVGYDVSDCCPDVQACYDWVEFAKRFLRYNFPGDETVEGFCKLSDIGFSIEQQHRLIAKLNAIVAVPTIIKKDIQMKNEKETEIVVNVSNNNTQTQNQCNEQKSVILVSDNESPEPSSGILTKLKAGCFAVVTGLLVDVLSDLNLWQWLYYHLELILGCILL